MSYIAIYKHVYTALVVENVDKQIFSKTGQKCRYNLMNYILAISMTINILWLSSILQRIENCIYSLMMEHDNVSKGMYICMCGWVTLLYSRKLTENCKPAMMEKIKIIFKIF